MRPPPLFLLQIFNALIGFGSMLTAMTSISTWKNAGWSAVLIGGIMTIGNLCYGGLVAQGGRLADRYGRAITGFAGALLGIAGCALVLIEPSPFTAVMATMLGFAGPALFFPSCAGLFSDAVVGDAGGLAQVEPTPLHVKVSRYNLGWATGNCVAFAAVGVLASQPASVGYICAGIAFMLVALGLWRWRALPPKPPAPEGDRAPHPALPRLTLTARIALFVACVLGMAMISQIEKAFGAAVGINDEQAKRLTGITLASYSGGYIAMFLILGRWTGWVLKPWRLLLCQVGLIIGAIGLFILSGNKSDLPILLGLCGACIGLGYGAVYTGSIYYSLRLPEGAARAAGLHETFLGLGNTAGPVLGGLWLGYIMPGLPGLALFVMAFAACCLLFQVAMIPAAVRQGAR